jgi:hypothetical protein
MSGAIAPVNVVVNNQVDPRIATSLRAIASEARSAESSIRGLNYALANGSAQGIRAVAQYQNSQARLLNAQRQVNQAAQQQVRGLGQVSQATQTVSGYNNAFQNRIDCVGARTVTRPVHAVCRFVDGLG